MSRPQVQFAIEYVLMGLLARRPMHGYDLYKEVTALEPIAMIWNIKQSQLYALLEKLEREGLLTSKIIPGGTHPSRRQFFLTETGREALTAWSTSPVAHPRDFRQDFLARLFFAAQAGPGQALELVARQRECCREWLAGLEAQHRKAVSTQCYEKLVFSFRISQVQATLEWLEECEQELAQ